MSTRSSILIRLHDYDFGATLKVKKEFALVHGLSENVINNDIEDIVIPLSSDTKYLGIYCHHDGYPEYMAVMLYQHYNNYDDALNLILCGDTSTIEDLHTEAYVSRGEYWEFVCPTQFKEPDVVTSDAEYIYVFENGRWKFSEVPFDTADKQFVWKDVVKYLNNEIE